MVSYLAKYDLFYHFWCRREDIDWTEGCTIIWRCIRFLDWDYFTCFNVDGKVLVTIDRFIMLWRAGSSIGWKSLISFIEMPSVPTDLVALICLIDWFSCFLVIGLIPKDPSKFFPLTNSPIPAAGSLTGCTNLSLIFFIF